MKSIKYLFGILAFTVWSLNLVAQAEVTYRLAYDSGTEVYTVSMSSNTVFSGTAATFFNSVQATVVAPAVGGGFQINTLTNLQGGTTPLNWAFTRIDAPSENTAKDYLFFSPDNTGAYSAFNIPANTYIDLFSFKSGSGCVGDLALIENGMDPLNANVSLNPDNNMIILGAGAGNKWISNSSGAVSCAACLSESGVLGF